MFKEPALMLPKTLDSKKHSDRYLMRLLLVSATKTFPEGPSARPPGSESCVALPLPSAKPGFPVPAMVEILSLEGSSACTIAEQVTHC